MLQLHSDAPGGVHEGGDGLVLEAGDVLDGEVDDEADDPGEDADGEAEGPLEHHVPHLVALGPRPPVLVEQLVLYHPVRHPIQSNPAVSHTPRDPSINPSIGQILQTDMET